MMKHLIILSFVFSALAFLFVACGDGESACAAENGIICTNCATGCDISCGAGEQEVCVGLSYFGDDSQDNLRCAFCE